MCWYTFPIPSQRIRHSALEVFRKIIPCSPFHLMCDGRVENCAHGLIIHGATSSNIPTHVLMSPGAARGKPIHLSLRPSGLGCQSIIPDEALHIISECLQLIACERKTRDHDQHQSSARYKLRSLFSSYCSSSPH